MSKFWTYLGCLAAALFVAGTTPTPALQQSAHLISHIFG